MEYLKTWTSFRQVMSPLSDDEKGRLFDAMLLYAETGEEPSDFKGNERFLWQVAKQDIDRTSQKCEALKANASKGGLAKSKNRQMMPDDSKSCQTVANDSNDQQIEADSAHKSNIKKSNIKKNNNKFIPPTREEVAEYCKERKNNVDADRFVDYYTAKGWLVGKTPMKDWKAAVRTWEKTETSPTKKVTAQDFEQRDYSSVPDDLLASLGKEIAKERDAG